MISKMVSIVGMTGLLATLSWRFERAPSTKTPSKSPTIDSKWSLNNYNTSMHSTATSIYCGYFYFLFLPKTSITKNNDKSATPTSRKKFWGSSGTLIQRETFNNAGMLISILKVMLLSAKIKVCSWEYKEWMRCGQKRQEKTKWFCLRFPR